MANVLISMPIQASSQWVLDKVIVVPRPRLITKIDCVRGDINKGWILTIVFGVWTRKLF